MAIEKIKSWLPFWSYQLNGTANPAHLPQNWAKLDESAGSSKMAPRILIFSDATGFDYSFCVKFIVTYAPTFLGYNNSVLAIVSQ